MAKIYICLEETKGRIDELPIVYMINPNLNINKAFNEKVTKCMKTKSSAITQPHITIISAKNTTRVLELIMLYETRNNPKKVFKVLSYVIYIIISNYVCIEYLASESKIIIDFSVGYGEGYKHEEESYNKILGIGIPDLLMNFMSCHGFLENKDPIIILKCPKIMFE